jgi:hypothetical protein
MGGIGPDFDGGASIKWRAPELVRILLTRRPWLWWGKARQRVSWVKRVVSFMVHKRGDRHPAKRELADNV